MDGVCLLTFIEKGFIMQKRGLLGCLSLQIFPSYFRYYVIKQVASLLLK